MATKAKDETASTVKYQVIRAITAGSGQTYMPGEVIEPGDDWPFHRARQLAEQGYLLPLAVKETANAK